MERVMPRPSRTVARSALAAKTRKAQVVLADYTKEVFRFWGRRGLGSLGESN
jgi:hypothetical protein